MSLLQVFHDVAYKAKDRSDLVAGIDEFLDQVTVLPPGEWDPTIRIEPPKSVPSQVSQFSNSMHSFITDLDFSDAQKFQTENIHPKMIFQFWTKHFLRVEFID